MDYHTPDRHPNGHPNKSAITLVFFVQVYVLTLHLALPLPKTDSVSSLESCFLVQCIF